MVNYNETSFYNLKSRHMNLQYTCLYVVSFLVDIVVAFLRCVRKILYLLSIKSYKKKKEIINCMFNKKYLFNFSSLNHLFNILFEFL